MFSTVPSCYQHVPLYFLVTSLFKSTFWLLACSTGPSGYQLAPHYLMVINLFHGAFWLSACSTVPVSYQLVPLYLLVNNLFHNTFWLSACSMAHTHIVWAKGRQLAYTSLWWQIHLHHYITTYDNGNCVLLTHNVEQHTSISCTSWDRKHSRKED